MKEKKSVLLLLSGGYDSPVAGYLVKNEGFHVKAVHFSQEPFTDNSPEIKAQQLAKRLGFDPLFIINISHQLLSISEQCKRSYYFIHMKRLMYRIATEIAIREGCQFLVTGESLGQVSSQTLSNLRCLDDAITTIPVLRPLIWMVKHEIISLNKMIGCYDISSGPETCDRLGPKHPETHARLEKIQQDEKKVDFQQLINKAMESLRKVDTANLELSQEEIAQVK